MLPPLPTHFLRWAVLAAVATLCACEAPVDTTLTQLDDFREALPNTEALSVELPGLDTQGDTVVLPGDAERGAETYRAAANMIAQMHRTLRGVIEPIQALPDHLEAEVVEDDRMVWSGRREGDDHDLKLVVERRDAASFGFVLLVALGPEGAEQWHPLASGAHTAGSEAGDGRGSVAVDLEIDGNPASTGKLLANWSSLRGNRTLTLFLFEFDVPTEYASPPSPNGGGGHEKGGGGPKHGPGGGKDSDKHPKAGSVYHYERNKDGSGELMYSSSAAEIYAGREGRQPLLEKVRGAVRWTTSGAGRADVYAHGGDIERAGFKESVLSQCWREEDFALVYELRRVRAAGQPMREIAREGRVEECPKGLREPQTPLLPEAGRPPFPNDMDREAEQAAPHQPRD